MGALANSTEVTPPPLESTSENVEALLEAARYDDLDDLKSLASAGTSLDAKDSQGRTALHMASANGHLEIVEYLVSHGVDVNAANTENNTPLHWACLNGHVEVVKFLILAGANVAVLNSHENTPVDEALHQRKMDVLDAVNEAMAQVELRATQMVEEPYVMQNFQMVEEPMQNLVRNLICPTFVAFLQDK
ncbi:OLC1v1033181C1 [Oldenlandia corymbosa var. corymbosa]|uniref:OLC1v1033181C1 n=1 Tax=Oldenlandia corymbosa var. corymbosa TaxID=529605 RepID=A0AAV1CMM4_OLDCO|nr:OLC1v1033181C1 [Oldenlandia corymbosa var. corymbosa]